MIEPVTFDLEVPQGHVTVELIDADSGKVVQREEGDNFITPWAIEQARWWQHQMWGNRNPVHVNDAHGYGPMTMPYFPNDHLAYWNDDAAEAPLTESRITKPLVGWAHRVPVGSPTGQRGVVNITESAWGPSEAKWVFDWLTSCGNGTFQSVGWTRVEERSGCPSCYWPEDDAVGFTPVHPTPIGNTMSSLWWDGTSWFCLDNSQTYPTARILSMPAAGGAPTVGVTIPTTIASGSSRQPYGLARIGTDFIITGITSGAQPYVARMTAAGTQTWYRTETTFTPVSQLGYYDVDIDGAGDIWVTDGVGQPTTNNPRVHRLNPTDGTILTTVGPLVIPNQPTATVTRIWGIAYDPADTNFWVALGGSSWNAVVKMTPAGTIIGPTIGFGGSYNVPSTAPYPGNYTVTPNRAREQYVLYYNAGQQGDQPLGTQQNLGGGWTPTYGLAMKGTDLYAGFATAGGHTTLAIPVRGRNLASRVRLASPVTKASSQALKITYTLTFT